MPRFIIQLTLSFEDLLKSCTMPTKLFAASQTLYTSALPFEANVCFECIPNVVYVVQYHWPFNLHIKQFHSVNAPTTVVVTKYFSCTGNVSTLTSLKNVMEHTLIDPSTVNSVAISNSCS